MPRPWEMSTLLGKIALALTLLPPAGVGLSVAFC
jgi:hypothetical protein